MIARALRIGFVMIRKIGTTPGNTMNTCYSTEYSDDCLEIDNDLINETDTILLVDDCISTGGTMKAGLDLLSRKAKIAASFVLFRDDKYKKEAQEKMFPVKIYSLFSK